MPEEMNALEDPKVKCSGILKSFRESEEVKAAKDLDGIQH